MIWKLFIRQITKRLLCGILLTVDHLLRKASKCWEIGRPPASFIQLPRFSRRQRKAINVCVYMEGETIMQEAVVLPLAAWQNFYVIIGSAAATLTGLTFVMVTLVAGTGAPRTNESVAAFGTPTVVHFGFAL